MTIQETIDAVLDWVVATLPELAGSTYDHDVATKTKPLPDVLCEVTDQRVIPASEEFPQLAFQQAHVRVRAIELSFMAELTDFESTDAVRAAALQLRGFAERLEAVKLEDGTLGSRVIATSQSHRFEFRPGFVEFEDGTRGREMRLQLAVAEPVGAD